jgi:hypothetical protein
MKHLEMELEQRFDAFCKSYKDSARATAESLESQRPQFLTSYRRMATLQAWRTELLEKTISPDSLAFFLEPQNDALTSHVLASYGAWRSALKCIRSCIENVIYAIYYKDHPIELQLWLDGKHRPAFSEMLTYFRGHPALAKMPEQSTGLDLIDRQFSTLSRAVHGSTIDFRMSAEGVGVQLWSADIARLGKWMKNERDALMGLNRLLMAIFREHLQQTRLPNLRKTISLIISDKHHADIKKRFGISLLS